MNQALFERLYVYDEAVDAQLTELVEVLLAPDLRARLDEELTALTIPNQGNDP